jgi:hypothetical protein
MTWHDVLERFESAGLNPIEDTFMENYGKLLSAQQPKFRDRYFRCTFGVLHCGGTRIEVFLFPEPVQAEEFLEIAGTDPWWFNQSNAVLHFTECDPDRVQTVMNAIAP